MVANWRNQEIHATFELGVLQIEDLRLTIKILAWVFEAARTETGGLLSLIEYPGGMYQYPHFVIYLTYLQSTLLSRINLT